MIESNYKLMKALRGADIKASEYRVLTTLATYADRNGGNARPSNATLAMDCCLNIDTVTAALRVLKERGWIRLVQRGGGGGKGTGRANTWELCVPSQCDHNPGSNPRSNPCATDSRTSRDESLPPEDSQGLSAFTPRNRPSLPPGFDRLTPRKRQGLPSSDQLSDQNSSGDVSSAADGALSDPLSGSPEDAPAVGNFQMTDDWLPPDRSWTTMADRYPLLDLRQQTEQFRHHWINRPARTDAEWTEAWRRWLLKAHRDATTTGTPESDALVAGVLGPRGYPMATLYDLSGWVVRMLTQADDDPDKPDTNADPWWTPEKITVALQVWHEKYLERPDTTVPGLLPCLDPEVVHRLPMEQAEIDGEVHLTQPVQRQGEHQ